MLRNYLDYWRFKFGKEQDVYSLAGHHVLNCIFVHIPKTGGVSINKSLYYCLGGGHRTALEYQDLLGAESYQRYFSFTVFRDPVDRFLSSYNYVFSGGSFLEDKLWLDQHNYEFEDVNEFIFKYLECFQTSKVHFRTQCSFIYDLDKNVLVDRVIDFKNLTAGFEGVCAELGISRTLERVNTQTRNFADLGDLSSESLAKLRTLFRDDFEFYEKLQL